MNYIDTLQNQVQGMAQGFVAVLPNLVIALIVLIITWLVAKFATGIADRLIGNTSMRPSLKKLVETLVKLAIWLIGILIAAAVAIPGFTPAGAIAGLGIGAVAIGFAFQDIFENFLAGVLIMLREKMRIGDVIEVEGIIGRVENITLRETHLRQMSNELTIMPNAMIFKSPVKILTDDERARTEIIVGVDYTADLDQSEQVLRSAVEGLDGIDMEKGVEVYAIEFGGSSINFKIRFWSGSKPRDGWQARHLAIKSIKKALDNAGIGIPFPIVTNMFPDALRVEQKTVGKFSNEG
ncbi:mechanosensitive ion channel family protein [Aurantiacibacter marinus]|uniref:Small-conductance mechanosensitive channel n=1 Tax=Aurantiacibacter marinus TaxID=874156 RepID=A0A0H0XLC2_9SPHN|nr:mechanosensitive ion channel [Aurantiacibacter marinus]KLI63373.1 mechanosensitive ion channel protein MscS [Aurantiacibacter marinus]